MAAPPLVDLRSAVPGIAVDMRYAGPRNRLGRALYPSAACLALPGVARRLARAQESLAARGLRLLVWDAYRPLSVQRALWAACPDERFVAPPERGSRHNRGAAVDATLALPDGRALAMPCDFDDFGPEAARRVPGRAPELAERVDALTGAMEGAGFTGLDAEWWHFDDPDWRESPLLDWPLPSGVP